MCIWTRKTPFGFGRHRDRDIGIVEGMERFVGSAALAKLCILRARIVDYYVGMLRNIRFVTSTSDETFVLSLII